MPYWSGTLSTAPMTLGFRSRLRSRSSSTCMSHVNNGTCVLPDHTPPARAPLEAPRRWKIDSIHPKKLKEALRGSYLARPSRELSAFKLVRQVQQNAHAFYSLVLLSFTRGVREHGKVRHDRRYPSRWPGSRCSLRRYLILVHHR
ncbi:hypothetical protein CSOJ01_03751 [Colletotrichum sojae]|uniref:Uncharacterized protein n=1 Tax=Colletotrichum sojae TaxID=2175907 RepID=A0A8H6N0F5_9PEZI|nr:hypothetical protein CSOJ01_03751 [Colletotrichum sojae]